MNELIITELLPQRAPFLFVDQLVRADLKTATSSFLVKNDAIFVNNNELAEGGIVENIAQTCAAHIGYINKILKNETVKIGMIGSIKNLEIQRFPKVGDTIETTVEELFDISNMKVLNAQSKINGEIVATCEIKVALTDHES